MWTRARAYGLALIRGGPLLSLIFISLAACSKYNFLGQTDRASRSPASAGTQDSVPALPGSTPQTTCTTRLDEVYRLTKILFVVDTSGSNVTETDPSGVFSCDWWDFECIPPTDPNKNFRGGAIQRFFDRYRTRSNFHWGFITFSNSKARALINNGNTTLPVFSPKPIDMQNAVNTFYSISDVGDTPYSLALQMAHDAILGDPDLNSSEKPQYIVILITDGLPTDYRDGDGPVDLWSLTADIKNFISLATSRVMLNTVYYGAETLPGAVSLLRTVASYGNGQFAYAGSSKSTFSINDLIVIQQIECH